MEKMKIYRLSILAALLALAPTANAQLLKGTIKADSVKTVQVAYTLDGDAMSLEYQEMKCTPEGNFTFDMELPKQTLDANVYVGNDIFGVHLEKGKTAIISIERNKESGKLEASFDGDNKSLSEYYNAYSGAFDIMKYFSIDPAEGKSNEEYRADLEKAYAALKGKQSLLANEKNRDYYIRLSEGMYTWTKIRLIMDKAGEENKDFNEYPECKELMAAINPNDPINIATNLCIAWLSGNQKVKMEFGKDLTPHYMESMDLVEKHITQTDVRKMFVRYIGGTFFTYGGANGDVNTFWNRYKQFAKDYPEYIAAYEKNVTAAQKTAVGQDIPYNPVMARPDETTCKLSDLFGKLIYIDVWATWCGPCCKEIPYLEKVVEHFKGNDKVCIISISTDTNRKAWLKKLEADKPQWQQFILSREEQKAFMSAWGIGGIPRFILISKDGKILSADALRPSDERLIQTLEENM